MGFQADKMRMNLNEVYIVLDDLAFDWERSDTDRAVEMYKKGINIEKMAEELRPYTPMKTAIDEVALLLMDLARKNRIKPRKGGVA